MRFSPQGVAGLYEIEGRVKRRPNRTRFGRTLFPLSFRAKRGISRRKPRTRGALRTKIKVKNCTPLIRHLRCHLPPLLWGKASGGGGVFILTNYTVRRIRVPATRWKYSRRRTRRRYAKTSCPPPRRASALRWREWLLRRLREASARVCPIPGTNRNRRYTAESARRPFRLYEYASCCGT